MSRLKKHAAAAALLVTVVGGSEGLRQVAYPDPGTKGKPWTICYGHATGEVKPGDRMTVEQCKALLVADLEVYADQLERCLKVPVPDARFVALTSFAFNVGGKAACGSSVVRLINAGYPRAGCDALLKWNRAAGVVMPGLTARRQRERAFCLQDAA